MTQYNMFGLTQKGFVIAMTFFSFSVLNINPLKCISMNNQESKIEPQILSANSNEPSFDPYSQCCKNHKCQSI